MITCFYPKGTAISEKQTTLRFDWATGLTNVSSVRSSVIGPFQTEGWVCAQSLALPGNTADSSYSRASTELIMQCVYQALVIFNKTNDNDVF